MSVVLKFWLPLIVILAGWEGLIFYPQGLWYYLPVLILAAGWLSCHLARGQKKSERLGALLRFLAFSAGAFFWFLWLDFSWLKFLSPLFVWLLLVFLFKPQQEHGRLDANTALILFLFGTFFGAAVSFGVVTVLGWPLWAGALIFLAAEACLAQGADFGERPHWLGPGLPFLLVVFLGSELWAVIVWLPFSETVLALLATLAVLLLYDMAKYFVNPALSRRPIIIKKIIIYGCFLLAILLLSRWQ